MQLTPGQGLFVDYDLAAGLKQGERRQLHDDVKIPQDHIQMAGSMLELFDQQMGVSAIPITPCGIPIPTQGS